MVPCVRPNLHSVHSRFLGLYSHLFSLTLFDRFRCSCRALSTSWLSRYETIIKHVPAPVVRRTGDFSMLVTSVEYDNYVGKVCTGRVSSGCIKVGDVLRPVDRNSKKGEPMKVMKIFCRRGTVREDVAEASAGDIVSIAGVNGMVSDTLTDAEGDVAPISSPPLDSPTIAVTFSPNTSPVNGKDGGKFLTAAAIRDRLAREMENNVAIQVYPSPHENDGPRLTHFFESVSRVMHWSHCMTHQSPMVLQTVLVSEVL
jgi:predicted membrane GTPase involved in stress response